MTSEQAYLAMFFFLDDRYSRLPSDALGALLGELNLIRDGLPADPAVTADWNKAVERAKSTHAFQ